MDEWTLCFVLHVCTFVESLFINTVDPYLCSYRVTKNICGPEVILLKPVSAHGDLTLLVCLHKIQRIKRD